MIIPTSSSCALNFTINCYDSCLTCDYVGNDTDHKCTQCNAGYYYKEYTQNCYSGQIEHNYFNNVIEMYRPCKSNCDLCNDDITCQRCNEGYELLSEYSNDINDNDCVLKCDNLYYITNDKKLICIEKGEMCPPLYPCINKETKRCYESSELINGICEINLPETNDSNQIEDYIKHNIVNLNSNNFIEYKENYTTLVYDSRNMHCIKNLTQIELKECESEIRKKYLIEDDIPVLIGQTEFIDNGNVMFAFYLDDGREVDMSICTNVSVEISKEIDEDMLTLNTTKINILSKQSIDVFNTNDSFFNDDCFAFYDDINQNERDVTIIDRRTKYYQNVTLKKENCEYSSYNSEAMRLSFTCSVVHNNNIIYFTGEKINTFSSSPDDNNYNIVLCLSQIGKGGFNAKNIGNYIMLTIFIVQILFFTIYLCYLKTIFSSFSEEEKQTDTKESSEELTKKNDSNVFIYEKVRIGQINKNLNKTSDCSVTNYHSDTSPHHKPLSTSSLEIMDFENAILFDKRKFCSILYTRIQMFSTIYILCDKHSLKIKYIVLSTSLFYISLSMFFNALLYSNRYISHIFYNGYDFFYEIDKYLYTSFIVLCVKIIFDVVIIRNFPNENSEINQSEREEFMKKMKKCNCFLFFIVICLTFFMWYYILVFCSIYQKTQKFWICGSLFSIFINKMLTLIAAFVCTCLRVISLKNNNEILFHMGKIIEIC